MKWLKESDISAFLSRRKQGRHNRYSIIDRELLEYLSFRERNALSFLQMYTTAVLIDSGFML